MLTINNLSKKLGDFSISNISCEISKGEYFILLGASGVGKTILLEAIVGLLIPDSGTIFLNGTDITNEKIQNRGVSLVFQNQSLFPHLSVFNNIAYGLRTKKLNKQTINNKIQAISAELDITSLLFRNTTTLSGGESQRVALARALVIEPQCLLLDEPISSLDIRARSDMRALLRRLNRDRDITIIHVTHDYEEAISLASRIAVMENGKIAQIDTPVNIFHYPKSEFVAQFTGIKNFFCGSLSPKENSAQESTDFIVGKICFSILTNASETSGRIIIRSEDVTLSKTQVSSSARNNFKGVIKDVFNAKTGVEILVDIGLDIAALVTRESVENLGLEIGGEIFVSVKATAIRFLKD